MKTTDEARQTWCPWAVLPLKIVFYGVGIVTAFTSVLGLIPFFAVLYVNAQAPFGADFYGLEFMIFYVICVALQAFVYENVP